MRDLNELIQKAESYSKYEEENDWLAFEDVLAEIAEKKDPQCIKPLLELFDDETELHEVMFSIVPLVQSFDTKTYVKEFFRAVESLIRNAPEWAASLHFRIFNSGPHFEIYLYEASRSGEKTKSILKCFLTDLGQNEPDFSYRCNAVISAINT